VANCCQQFREILWQIAAINLESFCGKLLPAIVGSNLQNKLFFRKLSPQIVA
jgi:hypothetical protein